MAQVFFKKNLKTTLVSSMDKAGLVEKTISK